MTGLLSHFLIGFGASVIGSLPPGMISLTVLNTAIKHNFKQGFYVALAASSVEYFQALIAITFSNLIVSNQGLQSFIRLSAIPVFLVLALYFFLKDEKAKASSNTDQSISGFWKGLLAGMFNLLPIPFWIFWSSYFATNGWIDFKFGHLAIFALGISLGTFIVLLAYGRLGLYIFQKLGIVNRWVNKILGTIFLGLAIYEIVTL